uniref:Uncharacterized protein n=1 Tax=Arundo donax TaxID=35708 RepID=A0A0A9F167_ARUDO
MRRHGRHRGPWVPPIPVTHSASGCDRLPAETMPPQPLAPLQAAAVEPPACLISPPPNANTCTWRRGWAAADEVREVVPSTCAPASRRPTAEAESFGR